MSEERWGWRKQKGQMQCFIGQEGSFIPVPPLMGDYWIVKWGIAMINQVWSLEITLWLKRGEQGRGKSSQYRRRKTCWKIFADVWSREWQLGLGSLQWLWRFREVVGCEGESDGWKWDQGKRELRMTIRRVAWAVVWDGWRGPSTETENRRLPLNTV